MRLLTIDEQGVIRPTHFYDSDKVPPYAILSHTWGADLDEVTLSDLRNGLATAKTGFAKLQFCAQQAKNDGLSFFWIDTCCIDKPNWTELSRSIISMYRWYQKAQKCYVYLSDVSALKRDSNGESQSTWQAAFCNSRWFTRGWTLQELLAPKVVEFFSRDGHLLGDKTNLESLIHSITKIPVQVLRGGPLEDVPPNERLRWAAGRQTKEKEDKIYCLLGIFDVALAPQYGEGDNAFFRLQEAISKRWNQLDPNLLASNSGASQHHTPPLPTALEPSDKHQDRRKELMMSLAFEQMDSRRLTIKDAQRTTCGWLLQHPIYMAWSDVSQRAPGKEILWISGKPGAGKSTLLKFTHAHASKSKIDKDIILSFFFNARGDGLEKSTLGLYRSLLLQILKSAPSLQQILDELDAPLPWTIATLQSLLITAVSRLNQKHIKCFIDALDECEEQQIRDMVLFFEEFGDCVQSDRNQLSVCFASRHYPTIQIREGQRLILEFEDGHSDDLAKYIKRHLREVKGRQGDELRDQVHQKANGVFMWAVLVVEILSDEYARGRIFAVRKRLEEIPEALSDLFKDMLRRDKVNMDDLLLSLQWILFAKRPLRREEFYYAMEAGLAFPDHASNKWKPELWAAGKIDAEYMSRSVLSSSKGLAELTKSKTPVVQFIHDSVRDFLIKDDGLRELFPGKLGHDLTSASHDRLKQCCQAYLPVDLSSILPPEGFLKASTTEARAFRHTIKTQAPFLQYASMYMMYHADEAAQDIPQHEFLEHFDVHTWVTTANQLEKHEIRQHISPDLPYLLAEANCARLITTLGTTDLGPQSQKERYQYPLLVAFAAGHLDAVKALLRGQPDMTIERIVRDPGFGKASQLLVSDTPLLWAVKHDNPTLVELLLVTEADVKTQSKLYGTFLQVASSRGNEKVVQLLLKRGADVNVQGSNLGVPLYTASTHGHESVVRLLLDEGADLDARGQDNTTALYAASDGGYDKVVQLLLDKGADVNAQGGHYGNALQAASDHSNDKIVQLLLDNGADVNAQGGLCGNALQAASACGNDKIVHLLLDNGADVNAQGGHYGNALQAASVRSNDKIVQLLLDKGANVNAQGGGHYGNALQAASVRSNDKIVQLLLDKGADVNAQSGGHYGNALQAALACSHDKIVQLLLDKGADVNAQGGHHSNALQAASVRGNDKIVQLLFDKGADVNRRSRHYSNAL